MSEDAAVWHYDEGATRRGPVTRSELLNMIEAKTLPRDVLVWGGVGDWQSAQSHPELSADMGPPPLPVPDVSAGWLWILLLVAGFGFSVHRVLVFNDVPLIGALPTYLFMAAVFLFVIYRDIQTVNGTTGDTAPDLDRAWPIASAFLPILFIPVYLHRRARLLKKGMYFVPLFIVALLGGILAAETDVPQQIYLSDAIPSCSDPMTESMARNMYASKIANNGEKLVRITSKTELEGSTPEKRICMISATTDLADPVRLRIEITPEGNQFYFYAQLQ